MDYKVIAEAFDANDAVDVIEFANGKRRVRIYDNAGGCWRVVRRLAVPCDPWEYDYAYRFVAGPTQRAVDDAAAGR